MQDTNDMLYFAEEVERGGFAAAGRHLGIPKSKLSRRVAELETRLGVRLLQRTTRKLSVTEVGEVYLRHCLAMRDAAEAAAEAVEQVQTEPRGTIRVACPVTLAQSTVGPIMALFLARHPQVRVDMRISNRVVDLVEEGVDVAHGVKYDDILNPVLGNGRYDDTLALFGGMNIWKACPVIIETLQAAGRLMGTTTITHSYPHCWRHKTPVIYRAAAQWFVRMDEGEG